MGAKKFFEVRCQVTRTCIVNVLAETHAEAKRLVEVMDGDVLFERGEHEEIVVDATASGERDVIEYDGDGEGISLYGEVQG